MNDAIAPRMGRPRFPPGKAKSVVVAVRLTPRDRAMFQRLGGVKWLRSQLEQAYFDARIEGPAPIPG